MQKNRNIFRNSTVQFNKNKMKILFSIACKNEDEIITQKFLAESLGLPLSTLNHHITNLRHEGLVAKNNHLTWQGNEIIQYFNHWDKTLQKKLRAHKIQVTIQIHRLPSKFFTLKHRIFKPFTNKKYNGLKGVLQGSTLMFYSARKLVVTVPDIFANTNEEIVGAIEQTITQIYQLLKLEFPKIVLGDYEICKFNSMHIAILNSIIAESHLIKKGSTFKSDKFCIDGSHGVPELECEKLENIFDNTNILVNYEELVQENANLKALNAQIQGTLINNKDKKENIEASNILAKIKNDKQNKMHRLQQNNVLPKGYGSYFL